MRRKRRVASINITPAASLDQYHSSSITGWYLLKPLWFHVFVGHLQDSLTISEMIPWHIQYAPPRKKKNMDTPKWCFVNLLTPFKYGPFLVSMLNFYKFLRYKRLQQAILSSCGHKSYQHHWRWINLPVQDLLVFFWETRKTPITFHYFC